MYSAWYAMKCAARERAPNRTGSDPRIDASRMTQNRAIINGRGLEEAIMTLTELLPELHGLDRTEKLKAMQFLTAELIVDQSPAPTTQATSRTLALLAEWASEDATTDTAEIAVRQQDGDDLLNSLRTSKLALHGVELPDEEAA
jgi:hypothetical protein